MPRSIHNLFYFLLTGIIISAASAICSDNNFPELLLNEKGKRITSRAEFEQMQPKYLDIMLEEVYGKVPEGKVDIRFDTMETNPIAMNGEATLKQIDIVLTRKDIEHKIRLILFTPNKVKGRVPTFLLLCNRRKTNIDPTRQKKSEFWPAEEIIDRGFGAAAVYLGDIDPDRDDGFHNGVHALFPEERKSDSWATLRAWAWGASKCVDYLVTDSKVNASQIAVIGHSRGGKAALLTGATDKRIALSISNDSGCGGAALSTRGAGETIAKINQVFPHWFCENFKKWNNRDKELPFDQHFLTAAIAPRAVYHASASFDNNADPYGEYLTLVKAEKVYSLYGLGGISQEQGFPEPGGSIHARNMAYHLRRGEHGLTLWDWDLFMDFADKTFRK